SGLRMRIGAPGARPDGKYTSVVGDVVEFDPPHRYSHTFRFTNLDDPPCKVTYDLEEVDAGTTRFTLTNENVPAGTKTEKYMTQGGDFITANLKALVETGKPTFSGRLILLMIKLSAPFSPARCKSENWP
ncbi:MAG: SRPBCC domain-containing protein, partial [Pseudomonadota bacterium]